MKKMLLVLCLLTSMGLFSRIIEPKALQDTLICASPGRGGTHLLRLVIQHYTERPFYRILTKPEKPFHLKYVTILDINPDFNKKPFYHTHSGEKCKLINSQTNKLVVIMRNPKELMISRAKRAIAKQQFPLTPQQENDYILSFILNPKNYRRPLWLLEAYDAWPETNRFLVTYEDLADHKQPMIEKLVQFLGEDPAIVAKKLPALKIRQTQSIELYNKTCKRTGGSLSGGNKARYHSISIPPKVLYEVDMLLEKHHPKLWKKYLSRYKEVSS